MDIIKSTSMMVGALVVSGLLLTTPVSAASACKGLAQSDCDSSVSCRWIDGYTRKDGKTVSAYCRTGSKAKSVVKKTAEKKEADKKEADKKEVDKTDKTKTAS